MKKSLIALAVAGALTAPMIAQADATLYGSLCANLISADEVGTENNTLALGDNSSRIGIRGNQDTGIDGVTATYRFETKASTQTGDFTGGRLSYIGLTTGVGDFYFGRQWTPTYLMVAGMTDILDSANSNPTHSYGSGLGGRQNSSSYTTPKMGGFQAAAALVTVDDFTGTDSDTIDAYNVAATFDIAGVRLAAGQSKNQDASTDVTTLGASYKMDAFYVAVTNANSDVGMRNGGIGKSSTELVASFQATPALLVLGQYVDRGKAASVDQGSQVGVEAQYKLGKKARVAAGYTAFNGDAENAGKRDALQLSYRVDF